ncbi:MFS transporter [Paramicrobacterium fandaimingii]|uniref:MFS transporter n=1 Tax=Paramicrobacterium fandaimingii TaxID=2708079 RepID=UPI0014203875|nr:MFS transporter [Microbacterium fandaimingii]
MTIDSRPELPSIATKPRNLRDAWLALAALSAVFLFEMLDNSIVNVALPSIGRDLHASTIDLQWVAGAYSLFFGGLMLLFGSVADRFGRRRVMLFGLALLALASATTALVTTPAELIAVRAVMGIAAAMTTPGSMALAFRLFDDEALRIRAMTVISTAGLVGLAVGPTAGGMILAVAPWQILLLINVPIAVVAFIGIRVGISVESRDDLHADHIDLAGAVLGTLTVVGALVTPTVFVHVTGATWAGWVAAVMTVAGGVAFVVRERVASQPLLDLRLFLRPLVASGLAYKAASGLAVAGLSYMATLQLQFAWGWSPALAAVGMLPQVVVLLASGRLVGPFVKWAGLTRAAWMSAAAVVAGLAVFAAGSRFGYAFVFVALVLVAAGMRVVGVVAGNNVLTGLPANRSSVGAALVDTSSELANGVGIAAVGTILAARVSGSVATTSWSAVRLAEFQDAITIAGVTLTAVATVLVGFGIIRSRHTSVVRHAR